MAQHTFTIYITKRAQKTILLFERPPTVMAYRNKCDTNWLSSWIRGSYNFECFHIVGYDAYSWFVPRMTRLISCAMIYWYIRWKGSGPRGYYVLTEWVGGLDGKIFGSRPWSMDQAQRALWVMNESQTFSGPAFPLIQ